MTAQDTMPTQPPAGAQGIAMTGQARTALRALAHVAVTITDRAGIEVARTHSGADGRFRFTGLGSGNYVLIAAREGYHPHAEAIALDAANPVAPYITLEPATSVHGVVLDSDSGAPVPAAAVTAVGQDGEVIASAVSEPDGSYRVAGIDGTEVTLVAATATADPVAKVVRLDAEAGPDHVVDLVLESYGTLGGTVTAGGHPVAWLRLTLCDHSGRTVGTTVTDEGGAYRFDRVKVGEYTLRSAASDAQVSALPAEADTLDVSLS